MIKFNRRRHFTFACLSVLSALGSRFVCGGRGEQCEQWLLLLLESKTTGALLLLLQSRLPACSAAKATQSREPANSRTDWRGCSNLNGCNFYLCGLAGALVRLSICLPACSLCGAVVHFAGHCLLLLLQIQWALFAGLAFFSGEILIALLLLLLRMPQPSSHCDAMRRKKEAKRRKQQQQLNHFIPRSRT